MSEQGDTVLSGCMTLFLSPWFWVGAVLLSCVVIALAYAAGGN